MERLHAASLLIAEITLKLIYECILVKYRNKYFLKRFKYEITFQTLINLKT